MANVRVRLQPLVQMINLPTVLKTATLPGDTTERLFIATQVGEIFYIDNGNIETFLDIRQRIIRLGTFGGYDERGLLGLAFHPEFNRNGLFYIHYSVAGSQGPGALPGPFRPDPCNTESLNLSWTDRETLYDHIDTVEEWVLGPGGQPEKLRTLLNLRRPFANHNGVNSLNFSPESGRLVLTTGDGGSGYDPFNLAQDDMEIAGKVIEIDVTMETFTGNPPVVTRFNELPRPVLETLTVVVKGVRNIPGIAYQRIEDQYIKYIGNVGQDLVESIYSFTGYGPVPASQLIQSALPPPPESGSGREKLVNLGWRGWEGIFPSPVIAQCPGNPALNEKTFAYYDEAVITSSRRILPLISYFHQDPRPDKFSGTALTGVQPYAGNAIPGLTGKIVFTDFVRRGDSQRQGVLAYTEIRTECKQNDYYVIEVDHDFGPQSAYYVSLGTNSDQTRLFLGVYGSANVTDFNKGIVFEIVP
jgi:hypothetical protein